MNLLTQPTISVTLHSDYQAVIERHFLDLFNWTGRRQQAVVVSPEPYEFQVYIGDAAQNEPQLAAVLTAAKGEGYGTKRKQDKSMPQEIVVLLNKTILVGSDTSDAWYIKKIQAVIQWKPLVLTPLQSITPPSVGGSVANASDGAANSTGNDLDR